MVFRKFVLFLLAAFLAASVTLAKKISTDVEEYQNIDQAVGQKEAGKPDSSSNMKQWFDRIDISGFVNAGWVKTGPDGAEPFGHFYAGERLFGANLFIDAQIFEDISAHNELYFYNQGVNLKELYIEFKDPLKTDGLLSAKVGRIDIPFGDEYLWQYPIDNPMILRTAEWPWGFSQGVLVFGHAGQLSWLTSVMDGLGNDARDTDDSPDKSLTGKVIFEPTDWLHLSVSGMENGKHAMSALEFNSIKITPVGAGGVTSTLGSSPTTFVDFQAYQADATLKVGKIVVLKGDYGMVNLQDVNPYARTFSYYFGEAKVNITPEFYVAGRYSSIGTFDGGKGYTFGGDYDNAPSTFGFDMKSLTRYGGALGYRINDNTILKVEVDNDVVQLIDAALALGFNPGGNRYTLASEVDVKF